jgi:hypothetical protein
MLKSEKKSASSRGFWCLGAVALKAAKERQLVPPCLSTGLPPRNNSGAAEGTFMKHDIRESLRRHFPVLVKIRT